MITVARQDVARAVNSSLALLYWNVGRRIRKDILKGKRADYGEQTVHSVRAQLAGEFGSGFGKRNLFNIVRFAQVFGDEATISLIFQWLIDEQLPVIEITRRLNQSGLRTERGYPWQRGTVINLLRNAIYAGTYYEDRIGTIAVHPNMSTDEPRELGLANQDRALTNAIELWAAGSTRPETWARDDKLQEKIAVVMRFFAFAGKGPAEVTPGDVERWREHLASRGQKPATVYARISRLSSFYRWLLANPVLQRHLLFNPAAQARPKYPRPYQSEAVKAWTDAETMALVDHVRALSDSGSVVAKRDYALLLFYLYTGLRRNELIALRGRDLEERDGTLVIKYRRKGGKLAAREVGAVEVYEALKDYLKRSGRSEALKTWAPLWTRHDRAGKGGAPLGSRAFANNLKKYARAAGIESAHVHQTRHTYARMVAEETGSLLETQEALDHENAATTRVYVQRITVKADKHGRRIAARLKRGTPV
jgi:integrase